MCEQRGKPFEWAFLLDALQDERDQGITIDTAQMLLQDRRARLPHHRRARHIEFLKNMITGAARAEAAVLVIDAGEGVQENTRRHGYMLRLLGIRQVVVVVNKMDLVGWTRGALREVPPSSAPPDEIGSSPPHVHPDLARDGDNICRAVGANMPWYDGPDPARGAGRVAKPVAAEDEPPLRAYRSRTSTSSTSAASSPAGSRAGVSASATRSFSRRSNDGARRQHRGVEPRGPRLPPAPGQSIGITLDEQIFVERGQIVSLVNQRPMVTNVFRRLFWLASTADAGQVLPPALRRQPAEHQVECREDRSKSINIDDLGPPRRQGRAQRDRRGRPAHRAGRSLSTVRPTTCTGRFVLLDGTRSSAAAHRHGRLCRSARRCKSQHLRVEHPSPRRSGGTANGHRGAILWLTGLSGAGKSTLAGAGAAPVPQGLVRSTCSMATTYARASTPIWASRRGPGREYPPRGRSRRAVRPRRLPSS